VKSEETVRSTAAWWRRSQVVCEVSSTQFIPGTTNTDRI